MKKIAILGSQGMLGSMVASYFRGIKDMPDYECTALGREMFDALTSDILKLNEYDWIINCIGIIKPNINEEDFESVENAILVNSGFPHYLARIDAKIIQIETDCVFSGLFSDKEYKESDPHDPLDVYGKTKSLGEVKRDGYYHIRTSIVGPELANHKSLMDWLLFQPRNAEIKGFVNHHWNGITTLAFAKLCLAIIKNEDLVMPELIHFTPKDQVSKLTLLNLLTEAFNRKDIKISQAYAPKDVNRILTTEFLETRNQLWDLAGYDKVPHVRDLIFELADYIHDWNYMEELNKI